MNARNLSVFSSDGVFGRHSRTLCPHLSLPPSNTLGTHDLQLGIGQLLSFDFG
jgi:hypothetical protein